MLYLILKEEQEAVIMVENKYELLLLSDVLTKDLRL
jgi:hypothetical protein